MNHRATIMSICLLSVVFMLACAGVKAGERVRAFPGAEGFGRYAKGGRGGRVIYVDNLGDYGADEDPIPGSLRAACEAEGPRTVLFRTSGTIRLKRPLIIDESYITIAGQTAPGDGICIRGNSFGVGTRDQMTTDVILRYLRVRTGPGEKKGDSPDALGINNARNVIIDHCSVSWGVDECLSITAHPTGYSNAGRVKREDYDGPVGVTENITVQWSIVSEGLSQSTHEKGEHSKGLMVAYGPDKVTLHHNLIAHNRDRNPYLPAECEDPFIVDVRNNLVYNWGTGTAISYDKINHNGRLNFVGNRYIPGPDSKERACLLMGVRTRVYLKDNLGAKRTKENQPQARAMSGNGVVADSPFDTPTVTTHRARKLEKVVLPHVGATLPERDAVDWRIVRELIQRTGGIIDDPSERGGWPQLNDTEPPTDEDRDGMPDQWETKHGFNPENAEDGSRDQDDDGYTNLEEYLNQTDPADITRVRTGDGVLGKTSDRRIQKTKKRLRDFRLEKRRVEQINHPQYLIPRLDGIEVDGKAGDWGGAGFRIQLLHRAMQDDRWEPRGNAGIRLGWDEKGLLVLVPLKDDRWVEDPKKLWKYDSVEMYMAPHRGSPQKFQAVIGPGMSKKLSKLKVNVHDHRKKKKGQLSVDAARTRNGKSATLEVRLPWDNFDIQPKNGCTAAFQIMLNDNDKPGSKYGASEHDAWYRALGAFMDSNRMHTIRLAEEASEPYSAAATLVSAYGENPVIRVDATPELAGKRCWVVAGTGSPDSQKSALRKSKLSQLENTPASQTTFKLGETGADMVVVWMGPFYVAGTEKVNGKTVDATHKNYRDVGAALVYSGRASNEQVDDPEDVDAE